MSLGRRVHQGGNSRKGIGLCPFKSISRLETLCHLSFVQSPQNYSSLRSRSQGIEAKGNGKEKKFWVSSKEYSTGLSEVTANGVALKEGKERLNRTMDAGGPRKKHSRRSIESVIQDQEKHQKSIFSQPQPSPTTFESKPNSNIQPIKSFNLTKSSLRRMIFNQKESKACHLHQPLLNKSNQHLETSTQIKQNQSLNCNFSIQICTSRGSKEKLLIPNSQTSQQVVNLLKDQYSLNEYTSKQLVVLIDKQMSHLNRMEMYRSIK